MIKRDEYIIGNGPAPDWCRGLLMHYCKYDGSMGYEFSGYDREFSLSKGDSIIRRPDGRIEIRRKVRNE